MSTGNAAAVLRAVLDEIGGAGGRAGRAPQESRLAGLVGEAGRRYVPFSIIIKGETS